MNGILIPQKIFVGDTAHFFFLLSEQDSYELTSQHFALNTPLPLQQIAHTDAMTIKEMQIVSKERGEYLMITFIPWETGTIYFPSLSFLKLKTTLPPIEVSSILEHTGKTSLQGPKPPMLIPGTDYLLYGGLITGIGIVVLLGTGGIFLFRKLIRKNAIRPARNRIRMLRKNVKQLHKDVKKIQKKMTQEKSFDAAVQIDTITDVRTWYGKLDRLFRKYLWSLFAEEGTVFQKSSGDYFFSATYTEITEKLMELFVSHKYIPDLFSIFYTMLEKQRFSSTEAAILRDYSATAQYLLKKTLHIAEKTEEAYMKLLRSREAVEDTTKDQLVSSV